MGLPAKREFPRLPLAAVFLAALVSLIAFSIAWIEDEDVDQGRYSEAYAYVGAFVNGDLFQCWLEGIQHKWGVKSGLSPDKVRANIIYYEGSTYAGTETIVWVDPDGDGVYDRDSRALAWIEIFGCSY